MATPDSRLDSSCRRLPSHIRQTLPWPSDILQLAQAFVEPHYSQIVPMILFRFSFILLDRRVPESLSGLLYLPRSSIPFRVSMSGEVRNHMGILPFEA